MAYPIQRLRRLRMKDGLRRLVRETRIAPESLIMPLFVRPGRGVRRPIPSMPGQFQLSQDEAVEQCRRIAEHRLGGVILFGIPDGKDARASRAYAEDGIIPESIRAIKREIPGLIVITDVCLCGYMDHGHCGVVKANPPPASRRAGKSSLDPEGGLGTRTPAGQIPARPAGGPNPKPIKASHEPRATSHGYYIDNDATLELLAETALAHARAGADMVAPSDMMDGRVGAIRSALDRNGFQDMPIMSYAAKYASAFYGPFRDAAESAPRFGDRRSYQMDPANAVEALREVACDIEEGADIVMVKPALAYGDIIRRVKDAFRVPVAAYSVSGEYAMVKAAVERGWFDERMVVMEILTGLKRAGADIIVTYWAEDAAQWLKNG
ncbi:MAG: porphobilinogen synthase [Candidatus Aureabacteria bacterium]|nr:porphobilinogen synthase [Candidatus Auribacterota bacterium]